MPRALSKILQCSVTYIQILTHSLYIRPPSRTHSSFFFFLNDPATTEIYPLPLPDALPILAGLVFEVPQQLLLGLLRGEPGDLLEPGTHRELLRDDGLLALVQRAPPLLEPAGPILEPRQPLLHERERSEEHTSELQSQSNLVCRLLLENKKKKFRDYH